MKLLVFLFLSFNLYADIDLVWKHLMKYEGKELMKEPTGDYSKYGIRDFAVREYNKRYNKNLKTAKLKEGDAKKIFEELYYKRYRLGNIQSKKIKVVATDTVYNQGIAGIILIQKSLNSIKKDSKLDVDGVIGSRTIKSINSIDEEVFLAQLKKERERYYRSRKNFDIYGDGWLKRLNEISKLKI